MACCGDPIRALSHSLPADLRLPERCSSVTTPIPGIMALQSEKFTDYRTATKEMEELTQILSRQNLTGWPLVVLVDDAHFLTEHLNNFLWVVFTRSNPSHDIYGVDSFFEHKHWGV